MLTKGIIMFACGSIGLIATIIWIIIDLVSKDKRETKIVEKAIRNTSKQPIKQKYNSVESVQMTEGLLPNNSSDYTVYNNEFNDNKRTEGLDITDSTQGIMNESTEKLKTPKIDLTEVLYKTEGLPITDSNVNETTVLNCPEQTVGLKLNTDKTKHKKYDATEILINENGNATENFNPQSNEK